MPLRDHYPNKMFLSDFTMKESLVKVKGELGEQTVEMDKGSKVWVVVRSVQNLSTNLGYKLTEGDIIKIGRVKLKVKQILIRNEEKTKMEESVRSECSQNKSENQINCRICFSSSNSQGNPLINPCKCSGSVQFIHLQCLKTWLKVKIYGNQNPFCTCFIWKQLECELCKTKFPPQFESEGQNFDLIELSKPDTGSCLVLEMFNRKSQNQSDEGKCLGVFILNMSLLNEQRVGRSHENEMRISDISVSRLHCTFKLVDGNVYLIDKNSKFGTLVRLKNHVVLNEETDGIEFQIGRSLIEVKHLQQQKSKCCFFIK